MLEAYVCRAGRMGGVMLMRCIVLCTKPGGTAKVDFISLVLVLGWEFFIIMWQKTPTSIGGG